MNKKNLFCTVAVATMSAFIMSSCNKQDAKMDEKSPKTETKSEMKIAYIEIDSIMTQYNFCKDYSKILEQKGQNIQKTIAQKGQALQNAAVKFQQDIQANKYTREQAEAVQGNLQKQDNDLQMLQQRLGNEFQTETDKYNKALRDSIQNFLTKYNKDKKYTFILSKVGDNMLYADKSCDITEEVIAGLNKAYKGTAKKTEEKKK
ncbi:MAG: OmpH family outer membrane protein [Prevotella sp.]|nr:OmpH family outer membrane protein [Prevotella sp.]MBR1526968.1 OmpH family outer membrane protein [Prevotella sp.]MDY6229238.1 OmpH family outer membrane protein [Prevotella sp.]MDY6408347.1 OmpH family outer membrane protein [Prevotella sp.]